MYKFKQLSKILLLIFISLSFSSSFSQKSSDLQGTWKARGYGSILIINSGTIKIFDITKISCHANVEYPLTIISEDSSVKNDVLNLKMGVTTILLDRISKLPELCSKKLSKKEIKDPEYNFQVLWHTFEEQYAYFKERNIDWQSLYKIYRNQVNQNTSNAELFAICNEMLEELNDGHVGISASEKIMKKASLVGNHDKPTRANINSLREAIISKYIKNPKRHNNLRTVWGKVNDSVGYIQLNSMTGQGEYGATNTTTAEEVKKLHLKYLSTAKNSMLDDINGIRSVMKVILNDLENTKKVILDVRFNGGGEDQVGLAVLSHFINATKIVFHKKNRIGDSYSEKYPFELSPADNTYDGQLIILQSNYSASATEILLLSSLAYENITRIGVTSGGAFSDILEKKLPNGWDFGLSNEIYEDNNGISYEAIGIPVHLDLNYPKDRNEFIIKLKTEIEKTGDLAIEHVLNN